MMRWLGSAVPAKPPKQKLFGDKPKYLPGFGGAPGGGTPTPPAEKPPAKKSSMLWLLGGAAVVGGVWWLSSGKMLENPRLNETTERLVKEVYGPGEYVARFHKAKPANPARLTSTQERIVSQFDGVELGRVSNVLVYDSALRYLKKSEATAFASVVKGGVLQAEEVPGPIIGAPPSRIGAHESRHYVLRRVR